MSQEGIKNNNIFDILRLLTPTEIARLTETASRKSSNSVSAIEFLEMSLNSDGIIDLSKITKSPRIVPINKNKNEFIDEIANEVLKEDSSLAEVENLEENVLQFNQPEKIITNKSSMKIAVGEDVINSIDIELTEEEMRLEKVGIVSNNKAKEISRIQKEQELKKMPSESVFLLSEREKIKKSQKKLYNQKAIDSYKTSSKNVTNEVSEGEEESSGDTGLLINKRRY